MTSGLFWGAACLAAAFSVVLARRFRATHAPVYGWWTVSFVLYAAAFAMEAVTVSSTWHQLWQYQLYIGASAGLVGAMSVGTTYLALPHSKIAWGYALYVSVVELALAIFLLVSPPVLHGTWSQLNAGQGGIVGATQICYLLLSAVGGPIVVLGSVWSWWKSRRWYTLLIAAGALIPTVAGTVASQGLGMVFLPMLNMVGLVLIFLGYVYSRPRAAAPRMHPVGGGTERFTMRRSG